MGTVYRTTCGCIASRPEPDQSEYQTVRQYVQAFRAWSKEWAAVSVAHETACPASPHYLER